MLTALTGLLVLGPLMLVIAVLVWSTSEGPVLFRQVRLTTGRREFTIYKFRSMRVSRGGPEFTVPGDRRVTRLGAVLRRTSLDELPQLVNLLRGEMTLVGPRPETPALAAHYPPELQFVLEATPGLTGPAQLRLRDHACFPPDVSDPERWYVDRVVPARAALDAAFLRAPSLLATLAVLAQTAVYLVTGRAPTARARG